MSPPIPQSPHLRKKRRQNLIYTGACLGATLAIFTYLFYPRAEQETGKRSEQPAAAETAPPSDHDPFAANSHNQPTSEDFPDTATDDAEREAALTPLPEPVDDGPAEPELTETELAKLPPWEADFMRLKLEQRLAFATAFTQAKKAYNNKQWTNCLVFLNECELIYSGSPNVWNLRACALLENNELDEAETCIQRSLSLNPNDAVALMCQSELCMLRRDYATCITLLERMRQTYSDEVNRPLHDAFTFHQLLCHLMLRQEMEARALVAELNPLSDSPLYYYSQAAFCIYQGNGKGALEQLRSATTIYGTAGVTDSYRKWMSKCGLTEKYVHSK